MKRVISLIMVLAMLISVMPVSVSAEDAVPEAEDIFNNHKYAVYDLSMTWTEAKEYCENLGGHLVTITSAEEQAFIESLLPEPYTKKQYWLGAQRVNGTIGWITGEKFSYTNWDYNQPDNSSGNTSQENYVEILNAPNPAFSSNSKRFKWNDISIDNTYPGESEFFCLDNVGFICEYDSSYGDVHYFSSWDAENQIAYFDTDPNEDALNFGSQVTEDTDTSFLENVDNLVGTYVLVETKSSDDGMIGPDILLSTSGAYPSVRMTSPS